MVVIAPMMIAAKNFLFCIVIDYTHCTTANALGFRYVARQF